MKPAAPGVFSITLPLPWELETVNVHLVKLAEGWLLVDSGIGTEACFAEFSKALEEGGVAWPEIRMLCLTHMHPDHIGLAARILELSGADLVMHRAEADYLANIARENRAPHYAEAMALAGVPQDLNENIAAIFGDLRRNFRALEPERPLQGDETIPVERGSLRAIWTPGHSPGHICLYSPEDRYLISGDHVLEYITPNIQWHPEDDMLGVYLDSLERLLPLDVDVVLPSHGEPFAGLHKRVRDTVAHHRDRCRLIVEELSAQPRTAHELVNSIWNGKLSAFHHHFAVVEILAHLEFMRRRGEVNPSANGFPAYWTPAKSPSS